MNKHQVHLSSSARKLIKGYSHNYHVNAHNDRLIGLDFPSCLATSSNTNLRKRKSRMIFRVTRKVKAQARSEVPWRDCENSSQRIEGFALRRRAMHCLLAGINNRQSRALSQTSSLVNQKAFSPCNFR